MVDDTMTLVIAFKCVVDEDSEGIIIASDTRATGGPIIMDVEKVFPITYYKEGEDTPIILAVASGAGNAGLVKQFARIAEDTILSLRKGRIMPVCRQCHKEIHNQPM